MKKILIPCDFSDTSESALKYAIALAKYLSADLVLLHVDIIPVVSPELGITPYSFGEMEEDSLNALKNLAGKIRIAESFENRIDYYSEIGNTVEVVSEHVKKLDVDLVVMGISGHGSNFMKNVIGSASVGVSKKIEVPLIIIPPGVVYHKLENIVYACNYDADLKDNSSLLKVKHIARIFESRLHVVHVLPEDHQLTAEEAGVDNFIEQSLKNSEHRTFIINEKNAGQGLLNFLKEHRVDMIIIEPKKHSLFHKIFYGSTTSEIAFNSPVPVLTIHNEK